MNNQPDICMAGWWKRTYEGWELVGPPGWKGPEIVPNIVDKKAGYVVRYNQHFMHTTTICEATRWLEKQLKCPVIPPIKDENDDRNVTIQQHIEKERHNFIKLLKGIVGDHSFWLSTFDAIRRGDYPK